MKTAISVTAEVFDLSERLARRLKLSRSAVFALGVARLGKEYDDEDITESLNEYYSSEKASLDAVIVKMASLSLPNEEW